jgi:hypothetical protein
LRVDAADGLSSEVSNGFCRTTDLFDDSNRGACDVLV